MATITITDTSTDLTTRETFSLDFLTERVTVRELIRSRVYQAVSEHNAAARQRFLEWVEAGEASGRRNPAAHEPASIDWEAQFTRALEAFEKGRYLIFVDSQPARELDTELELAAGTEVTFLRMTPLIGG